MDKNEEKEWLMSNGWKCETVVDAMLQVDDYDIGTTDEAFASLDEYVASIEQENQRLRELLKNMYKVHKGYIDSPAKRVEIKRAVRRELDKQKDGDVVHAAIKKETT